MPLPDESPLLSAEWLLEQLDAPDLVVLDASFFLPGQGRDAQQEYWKRHISGARFFDIDTIADTSSALPHMLPPANEFAAAVERMGIGNSTRVVVYDDNDFMASARVWWTFRFFGHKQVQVLDGGLHRWRALSHPLGADSSDIQTLKFMAHPDLALACNLDEVLDQIGQPQRQIIDARPPGRFRGDDPEPRPGLRSGHIPGSRSLFFKQLIDPSSHCLKPAHELVALFQNAGINPDKPITTTCGSGVTAAILALALHRLGNDSVAVYDGSWAEWGQHPKTPTATGDPTNF